MTNCSPSQKYEFIQTTDDGVTCNQQLRLNEETIWENELGCPMKLTGEQGIYMACNDSRVLQGQIKNFKFFTYES